MKSEAVHVATHDDQQVTDITSNGLHNPSTISRQQTPEEIADLQQIKRHKQRSTVLACAFAIILLSLFGVSIWYTTRNILRRRKKNGEGCRINGNQDMYGLGIRIGLYLQLAVVAFADIAMDQKYAIGQTPAILTFLIAMFVALITMLWSPNTYAVENFLVITMGNGITSILLGGTTRLDPLELVETYFTSFLRFLLWGVWRATSSAYWWTLVNSRYKAMDPGCQSHAWLVFEVQLTGGFQSAHKALNLLSWLGLVHSLIPYFVGTIIFVWTVIVPIRSQQIKDAAGRPISRFQLFFDYLFVEIGQLRGVMFGGQRDSKKALSRYTPSSESEKWVGRVRTEFYEWAAAQDEKVDRDERPKVQIRERLLKHIQLKYNISNKEYKVPGPTSVIIGRVQIQEAGDSTLTKYVKLGATPFNVLFTFRDYAVRFIRWIGLEYFPFLLFWDVSIIIFTILTMEFTLVMNGIWDVYYFDTAGQLVPFVVGLGGVCVIFSQFYVAKRGKALEKTGSSCDHCKKCSECCEAQVEKPLAGGGVS